MMKKGKKKSLHEIAVEIEGVFEHESGKSEISYKTLERRFNEFIKCCGGDINILKDSSGRIYFEEKEEEFIRYILLELADEESIMYKIVKGKDYEEISFDDVTNFMDDLNKLLRNKYSDEQVDFFMSSLDLKIQYGAQVELNNIMNIIDAIDSNLSTYIYTYRLQKLNELRIKLEQEFVNTTVEAVMNTGKLAEFIESTKELLEDNIGVQNYESSSDEEEEDDIQLEYLQRDRQTLNYLKENPYIKKHIEEKVGKKVEDIFNIAKEYMDKNDR